MSTAALANEWKFAPRAAVEETYTSNVRLGPKADPYELTNKVSKATFASRITVLRNKLRTMCTPLPPGMPPF